jgi:hypothetical protein
MKKANLVFISAVILFSLINISLVQADLIITVKYNDGCYVKGALVKVWKDQPQNEVYVGVTNKAGTVTVDSFYFPTCPYTYDVQVFKPDEILKDHISAYVDATCTGSRTSTLSEDTCLSMESKQCVDGYCCNSACSGTCEACNLGGSEGTCTNIPSGLDPNKECAATNCPDSCNIDSNSFTWDYADDVPNYCSGLGSCTSNSCIYNHVCADPFDTDNIFLWESLVRTCTADCDQTTDYNLAGSTCNYGCDITNTCSYQNYCSINPYCIDDNTRYYDGTCSGTGCSFINESCDNQDGCYNYSTGCEYKDYYCSSGTCEHHSEAKVDSWSDTGSTKWLSYGQCAEKEQKQQEFHDYGCCAAACTYNVTSTQWIYTGNIRNKPNGTPCNDGSSSTVNDVCKNGSCAGTPLKNCYGKICWPIICLGKYCIL